MRREIAVRSGKMTAEKVETWQVRQHQGKVATPPLGLLVGSWPTPDANMFGRGGQNPARVNPQRTYTINDATRGATPSGCLARTESFVVRLMILSAWLMGFPWSYLKNWERRGDKRQRNAAPVAAS